MDGYAGTVLAVVSTLVLILGIATAIQAVMEVRTAQGAIAWALSLVMFPVVAVPLYWVLGRSKFRGYVRARRMGNLEVHPLVQEAGRRAHEHGLIHRGGEPVRRVLEQLALLPFLRGNRVQLLIDGPPAFDAILAAIDQARDYILIQFYIVRDDRIGREVQARLIRKAVQGVRVYFLYDEIGSYALPRRYVRELAVAGVVVRPFRTTKGPRNRFQLNFRNHRKIVVVDGHVAFVGGLNIGDEYLGRNPKIGPWRDTHLQIEGPVVQAVQLTFLEDWHWANRETPPVNWQLQPADGEQKVLVLASGPADDRETCSLFFAQMIHAAQRRLWIASPYFVPDEQVMGALQLAALRGVDVRIVLPDNPDHVLVYLSAFSFLIEAEQAGVNIYRYQPGFMHHKVILVDDELAAVGTANLDNRSFRLNFEITVIVDDRGFAEQVAAMLERDFTRCRRARPEDLTQRPFWFRLAVRIARLMAPVQ